MEVKAWTVALHWAGEEACTTRGSAVSASSHSVWRWSRSGDNTENSSVEADTATETPDPDQETVSWMEVWSLTGGRWSWISDPRTGRVRWSPGDAGGHLLIS